MNIESEKENLCLRMMCLTPRGGREEAFFQEAALALGVEHATLYLYFPGGLADVLETFWTHIDREMIASYHAVSHDQQRTHEKIRWAVYTRLLLLSPYHAALKALWLQGIFHPLQTATLLFTVTDTIWRLAGDRSTDFNFYTKRGLLGAVYSATFLYWLNVGPSRLDDVGIFLDRRLRNVMGIQKIKSAVTNCLKRVLP